MNAPTINECLTLLFSDHEPHTSRELRRLLVTMNEAPHLSAFQRATGLRIEVIEGSHKSRRKYRLLTPLPCPTEKPSPSPSP